MRQRMSLARAILHDPKLLLLDEPFSNVDAHSAQAMVALLKGMRDAGKTVFVITHQAQLLEGVADEFVRMQSGEIVDRTASLARAGSVLMRTSLEHEPWSGGALARTACLREKQMSGQETPDEAHPGLNFAGMRHESLVGHHRDAGKRHPPRVALERCAERHAVLLSAGGGDLLCSRSIPWRKSRGTLSGGLV